MFKKLIASLLHISDGKEYAFDADTGRWITVHPNGAGEGKGRKIHLDETGHIDSKGPLAEALKAKGNKSDSGIRRSIVGAGSVEAGGESNPDTRTTRLAPNGKRSNLTDKQYDMVRTPEFKAWFGDWENDPEHASKVVDENGEPLVVYHGANEKFNVFDRSYIGSINGLWYGRGFYFSDSNSDASLYGKTRQFFINIRNPFYENDFDSLNVKVKGTDVGVLDAEIEISSIADRVLVSKSEDGDWVDVFTSVDDGKTWNHFTRRGKSIGYTDEQVKRSVAKDLFAEKHGIDLYEKPTMKSESSYIAEKIKSLGHDGVIAPSSNMPSANEYVAFSPTQIKSATDNTGAFSPSNPDIRYSIPNSRVANNRNTTRAMVDVLKGWIPGIEVSEVDEGDVIKNGNNERYSLILGEKGAARLDNAVNDLENLKVAKKMVNGKAWDTMSREEKLKVKVATGWEKGKDGKWRREAMDLPDVDYDKILGRESDEYKAAHEAEKKASNEYDRLILSPDASDEAMYAAKMRRDAAKKKLNEVRETSLYVPSTIGELYGETSDIVKAYPSLAGIKVGLFKGDGIVNGGRVAADKNGNVLGIFLPNGLLNDPAGIKDSITHEIQHVIQGEEGFGVGGNIGVGKEIEKRDEKARRERIRISDELYRNEKEELDNLVQKHGKKEDLNNLRKAYFGSSESMTKEEYEEKKRKILDSIPGYREKEQEIERAREERDKKDESLQEVYTRRKGYGNSLFAGTSGYARIAGEVEARNAGRRTQADRVTIGKELLEDTEDVSREDQVVIKDLQEALSIVNAAESGNGGGVGSSVRQMTHHGKVAGWYDRNTGKVALVKGVATPSTVAHEIGWHATFHWAEKNHPALHKKLLQYAKEAPEGIEKSVKEKYGTNLTPNELLDEIGAERFTREDISPLLDKAQKTASEQFFDRVENEQDNVRRAFVKANSALSRKELDEIAKLPPKEAVATLVQKMLDGRSLGGSGGRHPVGTGDSFGIRCSIEPILHALKRISIGIK